ncbi:MAG: cellulose-binding protein, partial [Streptomyces sp.]|nr:cellulose-binding protein [Streptomyces sp.]
MATSWHDHNKTGSRRSRLTLALSGLVALLLCLLPWSGTAVAHGSVVDPASRNYGCWLRWGSDFQNPAMAQED